MFPIDDILPPSPDDPGGKLLRLVQTDGRDVAKRGSESLGITRQAVNRRLRDLELQGVIEGTGATRSRIYALKKFTDSQVFLLNSDHDEGSVWRQFISPKLKGLTDAVAICQYAFTEMYNNAIEHSGGSGTVVKIERTAVSVRMDVIDDGVGIFHKLQTTYGYPSEREAVLELVKGRLTTDPSRHTGWGIFFTSRMCDHFTILSGHYAFIHDFNRDWCLERADLPQGTGVHMIVDVRPTRTMSAVLTGYSGSKPGGFHVTHVPLSLAKMGEEKLISRSQAKSVASRFDFFEEVVLDFSGIHEIGQAFADELFRVWQRDHSSIVLSIINANAAIDAQIKNARTLLSREAGEA